MGTQNSVTHTLVESCVQFCRPGLSPGPDPLPATTLLACDSTLLPNTISLPLFYGYYKKTAANQRGKQVNFMPITKPGDRCHHLLRQDLMAAGHCSERNQRVACRAVTF